MEETSRIDTHVQYSPEHVHGIDRYPMESLESEDEALSLEFNKSTERFKCSECGTEIVILTTVAHDLIDPATGVRA
jgi:hypothetical protein